jgi:CBS domain containing-hemolysin-like protein
MIEWIFFTAVAILIQGIFAGIEMSCVSFNKIRLQYYVSRGNRRAVWINYLLQRPSRLFGTTLICITTSLQMGSECARRLYESLHLDPDWAPITQVLIVVIFGELVPMFTARRHPERIAMFFAPVLLFMSRLFTPLTWGFDQLSRGIHWLMKSPRETPLFLSREEIKIAFKEGEFKEADEFNAIVTSIFNLKNAEAVQWMQPLAEMQLFPTTAKVSEVRKVLKDRYTPILPIYYRIPNNIVSVVDLRDLLRSTEDQKIMDQGRSPWFVAKDTSILQIIDQFRRNNQSMAIVLETTGQACGVLTLDRIIEGIFGKEEKLGIEEPLSYFVERTLPGSMTVAEFNRELKVMLPADPNLTLSDLILSTLDHAPSRGETIRIGEFEFVCVAPTLRGVKRLHVRSLQE